MDTKRFSLLLSLATLVAGCLGAAPRVSPATAEAAPVPTEPTPVPAPSAAALPVGPVVSLLPPSDVLAGLPDGDAQLDALCARKHQDPISLRLCARPQLSSLADLQNAAGVAIVDPARGNGGGDNASFALLGHSTSIAGRFVSPINPRAFLFTSPASIARLRRQAHKNPAFVALGFTRGEQLVELVARDPESNDLRFFLVRFEQACNASTHGCDNLDLFGPAIESNWTRASVYEDEDLKNTVLDCRVCHQPGGPGTPKMLRMQELQAPWTHFFRAVDEGNKIISDYFRAHASGESYAGIPAFIVAHSQPARLEGLVENEGFQAQPNEFPTAPIGFELGGGTEPAKSLNFRAIFRHAVDGSAIPTPYPGMRASDEKRLDEAARRYRAVMDGKLPREQMPSLADLQNDEARWMTSERPKPGLGGAGILRQMCGRCHNPSLDQTVSRARFDATRLETMSRYEKEQAIRRLRLPKDAREKMPPARFSELSETEIASVVAELEK